MKSRFQLVILFLLFLILSACQGSGGAFGPIFPTPTQIGIVNQEPVPVDFETLNSDPFIFVDRFVRVTGRYVPKRDAVCVSRQRGPSIDWYLISDGLQMEMSGYGSVVELAPEQAFFTLDGIWRQYTGPVGCTKEPVEKTVWYLEVVRIIDPNPLVASANSANRVTVIAPSSNTAVDPQPEGTVVPQEELESADSPTETATVRPSLTPQSNSNPTVSLTPTPFVVASPIPVTLTPVATTASGSRATVTPTPSLAASAVPSITVTATPTAADEDEDEEDDDDDDGLDGTGGGTPNPATPVSTPAGGYPGSDPATPGSAPPPTSYP